MLHKLLNIGTQHGSRNAVRITNLFAIVGVPLTLVNVAAQSIEFQIKVLEFWLINSVLILAYSCVFLFNWRNRNDLAKIWLLCVFVADMTLSSTRWFGSESLMFFHLIVVYPVAFLLWPNKPRVRNGALALTGCAFLVIFFWSSAPIFPSSVEQKHSAMAFVFINCAILLSIVAKLFSRDIQLVHRDLAEQAGIDPLTNILNRRELERQISLQSMTMLPCSVLLFDLDNFKKINDQYGHHAGDDALKYVVAQIQQKLPEKALFARIGGDEFCILLHYSSQFKALSLAQTLVSYIGNQSWDYQEHQLTLSISMGVAYETQRKNLSRLLIDADNAMYIAKRSGRNTFIAYWLQQANPISA